MQTLTKLALITLTLLAAISAKANWVNGHNGTYVAPYLRTPANNIPYDNLSYRGYPSQQPGYVSLRRSYSFDSEWSRPETIPSRDITKFQSQLLPKNDYYLPKTLDGRSRPSRFGI
jgi:hypothetical protein